LKNHDELDEELRSLFISTIRTAAKLAEESRDVEGLGALAQLIGSSIDWDKQEQKEEPVIGFSPSSAQLGGTHE
jgi:hypothetical protein